MICDTSLVEGHNYYYYYYVNFTVDANADRLLARPIEGIAESTKAM